MARVTWRSFSTAIFDCDSTLSEIEGIDELARICGKESQVAELTNAAMDGKIDLSEVYGRRLELLNPTKQQVVALKNAYKATTVPFARELLAHLSRTEVASYIVSGGLHDAVVEYGVWLGLPEENIFAVGATYDPLAGKWWSSESQPVYFQYEAGSLTKTVGKGDIIERRIWPTSKPRRILFGDGSSDLAAIDSVELFVAVAGVVSRDEVVNKASVVLTEPSLASTLMLIHGPEALSRDKIVDTKLLSASIEAVRRGALLFNDKNLEEKFSAAFDKAFKKES